MTVAALLKPAGFTNEVRYVDIVHRALAQMQAPTSGGMMSQYPLGFGQRLQAQVYALSKPREIAIVGEREGASTQASPSIVRDGYRPFQVVALGARSPQDAQISLLQDRGLEDGQAAAYVCRGLACQAPVMEPEGLRALLEQR